MIHRIPLSDASRVLNELLLHAFEQGSRRLMSAAGEESWRALMEDTPVDTGRLQGSLTVGHVPAPSDPDPGPGADTTVAEYRSVVGEFPAGNLYFTFDGNKATVVAAAQNFIEPALERAAKSDWPARQSVEAMTNALNRGVGR